MNTSNVTLVLSALVLTAASCAADPAPADPASTAPAQRAATDAPAPTGPKALLGAWKVTDKKLVVDVREAGDGLVGVVADAPVSRLVGETMFKNLVFDAASGTYSGQVLAVRRKEYVSAIFTVNGDTMTLQAGEGDSSKTMQWLRQ